MTPQIVAVDHFAGTGWSVAARWLGILEYGVEIMPEAIRTRRAVGFRTIYRDVWAGLLHPWLVPLHLLYIASPPCQTFSVAGRGTGRKALEMVLMLIASGAWKDPAKLRAAGADLGDDRTALVLTPLAHIWAHRPQLVALEQVPTVLPVWEAMADVMRGLGYSVWTGNLQAEQFGVPQTRKRAILMARLDGPVAPPVPTHSRYYPRDPQRLDEGVQKWVSMAEALGWGMTARPYPTIATGTEGGGTDPAALGGSGARKNVYTERAAGRWSPSGDIDNDTDGGILRLQASDASTLQSFPWGFTDRPAMTVHGHGLLTRGPSGQKEAIAAGLEAGTFIPRPPYTLDTARKPGEQREDYLSLSDRYEPDAVNFTVAEAALLQSYPAWSFERPATTVAGDPRMWAPGHKVNASDIARLGEDAARAMYGDRAGTGAYRMSIDEAATLQTYPAPFPFQGTRGKQFLQIGNAVPPLLAHAILRALIAPVQSEPAVTVERIVLGDTTADAFAQLKARAAEKAERAFARAEERLAQALEKYEREVAAHEKRGDGFFPESYIIARREAVLARKFHESKRSALATARAQMTAETLGVF
ncbi:DNA (cytosine-5)-methyltransferase 1 [Microbacterium foliorum]|uniref:DNA (cytosine-5-)-methyltransferase n=1 Tax=Microbacterium foliorum TaxID=104336 RepID=A0ABU1HRZ0_9MICO|nr:DNA cytosine methyltransferase [Microbacterium foliorum]MDR6142069.1 DNA (cytosine-5)-methyltransferase 1 [Microbacterium foliorum]